MAKSLQAVGLASKGDCLLCKGPDKKTIGYRWEEYEFPLCEKCHDYLNKNFHQNVNNQNGSSITIANGSQTKTVDLHSDESLDILGDLWLKEYVHHKLTHDITWMGIPIIQLPEDIVMMQELIWKLKPDAIVECGIAHGGSLIFYSSLLEIIGKGKIIGVDIEIREHNRAAIQNHPLFHRIKLFEGSSVSDETVKAIKEFVKDAEKVLVILDSNHSASHVAKELEIYKDIVTKESYMVAMDGAQAYFWDEPIGKPEWKTDNPLTAIEEFVKNHPNFKVDMHYNRLKATSNPRGFLLRLS